MYNKVLPSSSMSLNDITALSLSTSSEKENLGKRLTTLRKAEVHCYGEGGRERDRLYLVSQSKERWWCEVGRRGRGEVVGRGRG